MASEIVFFGVRGRDEPGSLTLVSLSHTCASAATLALRTAIVQEATYGYSALPIQTVLGVTVGSIGYLFRSIAVLAGTFRRWTATFGAIMSPVGITASGAPRDPWPIFLGICRFLRVPGVGLRFVFVGV